MPIDESSSPHHASLVLIDGYCGSTSFGNEGACEHDDKGSFGGVHLGSSWDSALRACSQQCLSCARCNYVSLSLQWNDCSWFNECSLDKLHHEVKGHRSVRIRRHDANEGSRAVDDKASVQDDHTSLWKYLRSLPSIDQSSCWVLRCSSSRLHPLLAVGIAPVAHSYAVAAEAKQSYGHIWRVVESFFQCVVLEGLTPPGWNITKDAAGGSETAAPTHRRVLIPSRMQFEGATWALFHELCTLFSGPASRLTVVREPSLPHCPPPWEGGHKRRLSARPYKDSRCCLNDSTRAAMRTARGDRLQIAELRPYPPSGERVHLQAMRRVVWANLGVANTPADTVLFVSNEGATNGRRIADEAAVADAVRRAVSALRPAWRFRYQRLESLSYANELRLLRRTTIMIGLFGSNLHNCRFLDAGAAVLQIHGALKGELGSLYQYRHVCHKGLGLRWAAYVAPGWNCSVYKPESEKALECSGTEPKGRDFTVARVDPASFVRFFTAALEGNWSQLSEGSVTHEPSPRE